jgi:hypothetical protein
MWETAPLYPDMWETAPWPSDGSTEPAIFQSLTKLHGE